jgi:hypothetical protein
MKEAAAGTPDGETALYEYLERLITRPETALEGDTMNANEKNVKSLRQCLGKRATGVLRVRKKQTASRRRQAVPAQPAGKR